MIEVEVKFRVDSIPDTLSRLIPINTKRQNDIYYDTSRYSLLCNGNFMRIRNNSRLEFKLNQGDISHLYCEELVFDLPDIHAYSDALVRIIDLIGLVPPKRIMSVDDILYCNKMIVLANIDKKRLEYNFSNGVIVYYDNVYDLGRFIEADLVLPDADYLPTTFKGAEDTLLKILSDNSIIIDETNRVRLGYVEMFLQKYNPIAFDLGLYK